MSGSSVSEVAEPVRILSDLHLGHPASQIRRVESLRPLISGAGTVIFNGDTCEQCCHDWREEGAQLLAELKALCLEEGADPVFLAGNHDPEISDRGWLELEGGMIFVTHGHALYPGVAPWSYEFLNRRRRVLEIMDGQDTVEKTLAEQWQDTQELTEALKASEPRKMRGRRYLLSALWPPRRSFNILRVWLTMVAEADQFLQRFRPEARLLVFGHFHRHGIWQRGRRTICNGGAFMHGALPLVSELKDGWFRVIEADQRKGEYRLRSARASFRTRP